MHKAGSLLFLGTLVVGLGQPLPAQSQAAKLVNIDGIVVDDARAPVPSAELSLTQDGQAVRSVRSGADGRFSFVGVPARPGSITVRRLGYQMRTIPVDMISLTSGRPLEFALEAVASDIEPVMVDASSGRMAEFSAHRRNSSFGHFFDQRDIQKLSPRYVSDLFRTVPGATIQVASGIGNRVMLRGCRPRIWVNGVRTVNTEIDEVARPSEIDGIEIYPSSAGTPPQYFDRENRACGTVVVWTRR